MKFQKLKGTADILPEETRKWQYIERTTQDLLEKYNFQEIRIPMFEQFELFARGVGETSDIVSKEMYDFYDKGDRHISLRPEGTAGIVRAYVENKLYGPEHHKPQKFYYIGPMFRFERPQSGRMRQFHQLGVEVFGSNNPSTDAETMYLALELAKTFGLTKLKLVINSLGSNESRKKYREALIDFLEPHFDELSEDSQRRLYKNPLRVLDSKDKKDQELIQGSPSILDFLDEESKDHFEKVKVILESLGVSYQVDSNMVRGLDYYNDTIFEVVTDHPEFGSNTTIIAGGRYDSLVAEVGGPDVPGFGFAAGLERLLLLMQHEEIAIPQVNSLDAYIVTIGEQANLKAPTIASWLRKHGLKVDQEFMKRKPGKQFKTADKLNAKTVFILGDNELENEEVTIKNLASSQEKQITFADLQKDNFCENFKSLLTNESI